MPKAEPTHGICLVMVHEDIGCHVHLFRKWQEFQMSPIIVWWQNSLGLTKVNSCFSPALVHQLLADHLVTVVALECSLESFQSFLVVVGRQKHLSCPVWASSNTLFFAVTTYLWWPNQLVGSNSTSLLASCGRQRSIDFQRRMDREMSKTKN